MAYYSSETCGYVNNSWIKTDCITNYAQSEVKYVVDTWKITKAPVASEARLITYDELIDNLGYEWGVVDPSNEWWKQSALTPTWLYSSLYDYWTMSQFDDSEDCVMEVRRQESHAGGVLNSNVAVRPVITINKSYLN